MATTHNRVSHRILCAITTYFNYFLIALEAVLNIKENGDCYISIAWSSINDVLAILRRIRLNWLGVIVVISLNLRQKAL